MKANELMMYDWVVDSDGEFCQITSIGRTEVNTTCLDEIDIDEIKPIPITPEILEKNGFEQMYAHGYDYNKFTIRGMQIDLDINIAYSNSQRPYPEPKDYIMPCKYVHELQHALRLCNIDKDIEL